MAGDNAQLPASPDVVSHRASGSASGGRRRAAAWAGLAAGPLAWAALLQANYMLSYVACEQRRTWMLHLATAAALGIAGLGALATWWAAPALRGPTSGTDQSRARFMALSALALCAWFALVILATEIPALMLQPCTP